MNIKNTLLLGLFLVLSLSLFAQNKYRVYVFLAEECPISIYMTNPLQQAVAQFSNQVDFYGVFPKKNSTSESAQAFFEAYDLPTFKTKLDHEQAFAQQVGATITPEVVVMNDQDELLYRGRISDAYRAPGKMKHGSRNNELLGVLTAIVNGQIVPQPWKEAVGCYITF